MGKTRYWAGLAASVLLVASFPHAAQGSGTVKGTDGAPWKGAFVEAQNSSTKITVTVLTAPDGRYRIESLPAGEYELRIRAIGYKADPHPGVKLSANEKASADLALQTGMFRWSDLSGYQGK